jgi:hypothetical protein
VARGFIYLIATIFLHTLNLKVNFMSILSEPKQEQLPPQTPGRKWCGVSFNPSRSKDVDKLNAEFASAADTLEEWWAGAINQTEDEILLYQSAKADLLRAQMLAVKLFTFNM